MKAAVSKYPGAEGKTQPGGKCEVALLRGYRLPCASANCDLI